jgi:hypothetical protein
VCEFIIDRVRLDDRIEIYRVHMFFLIDPRVWNMLGRDQIRVVACFYLFIFVALRENYVELERVRHVGKIFKCTLFMT